MHRTWRFLRRLFAAGAALALAALLALEPGRPQPVPPPDNGAAQRALMSSPFAAGLQVAIDPRTGDRIPAPPFQLQLLSPEHQAALRRSDEGLTIVQRPDGSKYVNLGGRFMCGIAVQVGTDGATSWCTRTPQQAVPARLAEAPSSRREVE
jgi:hypothetical protein